MKLSFKRNHSHELVSSFRKADQFSLQFTSWLQRNPDFSNPRVFETPDSSNQKSFPLGLLRSDTVILLRFFEPSILQNSRYFEPILGFLQLQKFTFDFSKFGKKCNAMEGNAAKSMCKIYTCINTVLVFVLLNFFPFTFSL